MNNSYKRTFKVLLYVVFAVLLILMISLKSNYHIDEFFSFNLANHHGISSIKIEDGIKYDFKSIFIEYTSVNSNNTFNISDVWNNQANDVHPPLFYLLLNTISSFFAGTFSKWYPGVINIVAALLTLFFVRKLLKLLTQNEIIIDCVSLIYILTTGILDDVAFFRMYELAMLWVVIVTYLIVSRIDRSEDIKFYILLTLFVYLGALTHYYCIIYFVLLSIVYGLYLLINKKYKDTLIFCICMIISGISSYLTFPSMITHMFSGYRGTEATSNLFDFSDYVDRILSFYKNINNEIFGELLTYVLISILVLLIACFLINSKKINSIFATKYLFLILPTTVYFLLVSKIAAYINERYISIVYPILIISLISLLFNLISNVINERSKYVIYIIGLILIGSGFYHAEWTYLYRDTKDIMEISKKYNNVDCICIHGDIEYDYLYNSIELVNYKSFTSLKQEEIQRIGEFVDDKELVIRLQKIENKEDSIKQILNVLSQYSNCEELGNTRNGTVYHLY